MLLHAGCEVWGYWGVVVEGAKLERGIKKVGRAVEHGEYDEQWLCGMWIMADGVELAVEMYTTMDYSECRIRSTACNSKSSHEDGSRTAQGPQYGPNAC
jgi:hypothetical protein